MSFIRASDDFSMTSEGLKSLVHKVQEVPYIIWLFMVCFLQCAASRPYHDTIEVKVWPSSQVFESTTLEHSECRGSSSPFLVLVTHRVRSC